VEVVLVGELHELAGRRPPGDAAERAAAYLAAWSSQRAVDGAAPSLAAVLGSAGLRALRRRMGRRFARAVPSAAPFLVGAAVAGRGNRKATEVLADRVRGDLRRLGPGPRQDA
jgi:Flp pilus assembly protein TadB